MSDRAGPPPFVPGADRLRGVLNNHQPVLIGNTHYRIHVGHLAIEVHRNDERVSSW